MAAPQNWSDTPHPYVGVPKPYPLDFTEKSWFGLPWYHFRCDWELDGPSPEHNLYNVSGDAASAHPLTSYSGEDRVVMWSNAYGGGIGDAVVHPNTACVEGLCGTDVAPRLVEIIIEGKPFRALSFTGREHLAINGAEVVNKYDLSNSPLYTTSGTLYQDKSYAGPGSRAGASFLFVVSADVSMRNGFYPNSQFLGISPYSTLLYGRNPQTNTPPYGDDLALFCANNPWSPWCPSGGAEHDIPANEIGWGPMEEDGLELWYAAGTPSSVPNSTEDWGWGGGSTTMMKFGPQGWHVCRGAGFQWPAPYIPTREENPIGDIEAKRGGSDGGFLNPPGFSIWGFPNYWPDCQSMPKTGLQALLVEFVNEDIVGPSHMDTPDSWPELLTPYNGPTVNVYGISKDWLPRAENDHPEGCPGFGSGESQMLKPVYTNKEICVSPEARTNPQNPSPPFDVMKYPHSYPAMKNKTLWDNKYLYLGGLPAVALTSDPAGNDGKYFHGFKGLIFEILMLEGVLNNSDKVTLFNTLKAKYNRGLG